VFADLELLAEDGSRWFEEALEKQKADGSVVFLKHGSPCEGSSIKDD
jgi:hypothetical protein